jgi:glycosyltransferase involved in cell wall biosynthesis
MGAVNHIGFFLPSLKFGGIERSAVDLANEFACRGLAVDILLARMEGEFLECVSQNTRIIDFHVSHVMHSIPSLFHYLRKHRPQVVIARSEHTAISLLIARKAARVRTKVVVSYDKFLLREVSISPNLKSRVLPFLIRCCYPWADAFIAPTYNAADDLARSIGIAKERISVIYNPVVTPVFVRALHDSAEHPWFADGEMPVVVGIGHLSKVKDFNTLIIAFSKVLSYQRARLIILGEGEERPALQALIDKLEISEHAHLLGYVPQPAAYLSKASVFVLSSLWETFGIVVIEALAAGLPVVATECAREILRDGLYGDLVPTRDSTAMAEAIIRALNGQKKVLPKGALEPFYLETVASQFLELIGCVLTENAA